MAGRRHLEIALAAALLALAGCGGDDNGGGGGERKAPAGDVAGAPTPKEPLEAVLPRFERAVEAGTCRALWRYAAASSTRGPGALPDDAPRAADCRQMARIRQSVRGFRATDSAEFGTTGVADGRGRGLREGEVLTTAWTLDTDRSWRLVLAGAFDPQVGEKPKASTDFDGHAQRWVEAAKKGKCDVMWRFTDAQSRFVVARDGDLAKFCSDVSEAYKQPEGTLKELAEAPNVRPRKLGETLDMAFYGLRLPTGRFVTLVLVTAAEDAPAKARREHRSPGVFDYVTNRKP